ncbi:LacI family transcriptional regulator [Actinomadura madurae]|uniref:LacI family DNA-binding transcriptional regulator n=1 Tax=Actinomadura madurae TaxID=1993 RepID=UPI00202694F9|nr:LacI family DNA-binding transcriptional regulator [Actinomadura madurae]URM94034.1 LacI family transcriptional regulator [Actinomadura madurae]URN04743.1 LacI family transcriptional regulator [Actinomadura madurae]
MQRPTIAQVAERAGVSTATVSRVLSGRGPVSAGVRRKVRRAAEELGYQVNPIARALRNSRTDTVGMVVPSISNPFFTSLVESVEHALGREGKELFLCDARSDPEIEARRLATLVARNVDGIIVSPCHGTESGPAVQATADRLPLVQLDRFVGGTSTDWVGVDDIAAMRQVMDHLREGGARSAAFVGSLLTNSSTEQRFAGFRRRAEELEIAVNPDHVLLGDYSVAWGETAAARLITAGGPPDAIVCADDLIALGVTRACRAHGVDVPGTVQVTGYDNIEFARLGEPALTTVDQPRERIAAEAVRLLAAAAARQGEGDGDGPRTSARVALVPSLVVRESTRAGAPVP